MRKKRAKYIMKIFGYGLLIALSVTICALILTFLTVYFPVLLQVIAVILSIFILGFMADTLIS